MEQKISKMDIAGREFKISNFPIETYATGNITVSLGDTVVMANVTMSDEGKEGAEYFPMAVDYEENMYAAGKIKGSRFIKREGRPSDNAVIISRLIDRPIRPLFPKGTTNEVQIICTALSIDMEVNPATTAMNAASMALLLSGAPFDGPIGAVRIGYVDDKLVINPTYEECEEGKLDLIVAGTLDAITMVEAAAKEVTEDVILEALQLAHKYIKELCQLQLDYAAQFEIKKIEASVVKPEEELVGKVKALVTDDMLDKIKGETKKDVKEKVHEIEGMLFEKFAKEIEEEEVSKRTLAEILNGLLEKRMRHNILEKEERIDGRKLTEIRPIKVIPDVLPRTHGSAIFQRGETTSLSITTLGGPGDAQLLDTMDKDITKRYIHHYHFPPYATGDIKRLFGPNRREIGHGDLAERALRPVLPAEEDFAGDMDFKVTGTADGLTALQMDIKVKGLSIELLKEALQQAKEGRDHIMSKMLEVIPETRKELSSYAPLIMTIQIDPDMIGAVIGKGGETIQEITKECDVEIDIADEGLVTITAPDQEKGKKAQDWVNQITYIPEVGEEFEGEVVRIMDFGAFVEFLPGKDGLVHISELSNEHVKRVEDVVKVGDKIKVKLIKRDDQGRYNLSHKAMLGGGGKSPSQGGGSAPSGGSQGGGGAHGDGKTPTPEKSSQGEEKNGELLDGTSSVRKV